MLMQPFSLDALRLVVHGDPRRHRDVHRRLEVSGVGDGEIRIENLGKSFGDFVAVRNSSFTVENGEFFCLLGPSGCGKTTTLRMIAGLELPTSGTILLGGEDVTFKRASERDIAFVFQLFALYPHMNVRRNIGFPLRCQGMPRAEIAAASRSGADPAHRASARPAGLRPLRRRPPARRARPRDRARADGLHDGRAARRARRRVPPPDVRRVARPARPHSTRPPSTSPTTSSRRWRWPTRSR